MRLFLSIMTIISILLSACSGEDKTALRQADAVMEEHPDSALAILQSINRNSLSHGDLPYYALLMTQAQIKNEIDVSSDSLISKAYAKYGDDWRGDKGIRSNFYMGEVLFNQKRNRDAMKYYLSAYEESKRLGNDYWHAKAAERIADLFFFAYNYDEATRYRLDAIQYYGKADRISNQRYAEADLAMEYINSAKHSEAITLLDSILKITEAEPNKDTFLLDYIKRCKIDALIASEKFNHLDKNDLSLLDNSIFNPYGIEAAIIKDKLGLTDDDGNPIVDLDSIAEIAPSDEYKAQVFYQLFYSTSRSGNPSKALHYVDSLLLYQNRVANKVLSESIAGAEKDFYADLSNTNDRKSKSLLLFSFGILIIGSIIIVLIMRIYRLKDIAQREELESTIESFMNLKILSENLESERLRMREDIKQKNSSIEQLEKTIEERIRTTEKLERQLQNAEHSKSELEADYENKIITVNSLDLFLTEKNQIIRNLEDEIHKYKIDINGLRQSITELEQKLNDQESDSSSYSRVLESLFKERWTTLNFLCNEYYEKGDSQKLRDTILMSIEKELKKIGSKKGLEQIEDAVNKYMNGIMHQLRNECSFLTEKELNLSLMIMAGFSAKSICHLLGIKKGNFYVSKRRLIDRISMSLSPNRDIFISKLS